eukprot:Gb_09371 [translate_table: standard]
MALVRKKKERGGGGGKTMADPPIISPSAFIPRVTKPVTKSRKSVEYAVDAASFHKENPPTRKIGIKDAAAARSSSRGRGLSLRTSQDTVSSEQQSPLKPLKENTRQPNRSGVRNPGRVVEDPKKIAKEEDTGLRWSTSSLPSNSTSSGNAEKGKKSAEPSFSRILSDLQRERRSRLSQKTFSGVSISQDGIEWLGDRNTAQPGSDTDTSRTNNPQPAKEDVPDSAQEKSFEKNDKEMLVEVGASSAQDKNTEKKDKEMLEEVESSNGKDGNKFPSKLHERLAFLEGRVNQIASELKKTKEMLDANNAEASKIMLSDIQVKICGIEKAMTVSALDDRTHLCSYRGEAEFKRAQSKPQQTEKVTLQEDCAVQKPSETHNAEITKIYEAPDQPHNLADGSEKRAIFVQNHANKGVQKESDGKVPQVESTIKRLSHKDLEERLFPHQKLLKNRPSVHLAVLKTRADLHDQLNQNGSLSEAGDVSENGPLSPIDEDPIAVEFLTSLNQKYRVISEFKEEGPEDGDSKPDAGISSSNENGNSHATSDDRDSAKDIQIDDNDPHLECDENLTFNDQENNPMSCGFIEEIEEIPIDRLNQLGHKTSTAGWFVSEGESILLAHDDGSCSFHDIANTEEKAEYKIPDGLTPNIWGDCWLIRAAGSDGRCGKYVVAASAGSTLDSGFCSWDFYNKEIMAFHSEAEAIPSSSGTFSSALMERNASRRSSCFSNIIPENQHWWYRPCGPLLVSTASAQKTVTIYDIRDGDLVMNWETQRLVTNMNFSSPLQWRNKGKVAVAENEVISIWDVNSIDPLPLQSVVFSGRKVSALHVHNTDAECSGGVRQRVNSSEAEGNDGVFCTQEAINIFDFRVPSGIGLKIPTFGEIGQSIFARGDSIFAGVVNTRISSKASIRCKVHQWSIRKGKPVCVYMFPESNAHIEHFSVAQVWGSFNFVMAVNGHGLFIFDACHEEGVQTSALDHLRTRGMREVIGPDDLYCPSFDYSGSRVLLVSKDRPACWRYWS